MPRPTRPAPIDPPHLHGVAARIGVRLGRGHIDYPEATARMAAYASVTATELFRGDGWLALLSRLELTISNAAEQTEGADLTMLQTHLRAMVRGRAPRLQMIAAAMTLARGFDLGEVEFSQAEALAEAAVRAVMAETDSLAHPSKRPAPARADSRRHGHA